MWPSSERPFFGTFVASQMASVSDFGVDVIVVFVDGEKSRRAYARAAFRLMKLNFTRDRFDLVHAHTGHCGVLACLQRRYPVLISYVGYDLYGKPKRGGGITIKSRLEALLFRQLGWLATATITKSAELESRLPEKLRRRNAVLPNGVDRSLFRPIRRDEARRILKWPHDELTVLFVANPSVARKRFELAQQAVALASAEVERVRLRVCSAIPHQLVHVWMSAADVLILTSVAEGSPNVVKEALACDLPVVAVAIGDVAGVVRRVRGCKVVPHDAGAGEIARALTEVCRAYPERCDGRAQTSHLSADAIAMRLVALYREVATATSRRSPLVGLAQDHD
jgi:glycosyltransferase involved in cell wall biosynthesis